MRATHLGLGSIGIVISIAAVSACGGDSEGGGGGGTGGSDAGNAVPIEEVPALYASSACAALQSCVGADLLILFFGGESCNARLKATVEDDLARLKQAIEDGKVVYDGTKVNACVAAIEAKGCDLGGDPPECTAALDGTIDKGAECAMDAECKGSDTYCKTDASCPGKCAPRELAGGPCKHDSDCATNLSCDKDVNKCYAPAALGAACGGGGTAPECKLGTFCIGSDDQAKKTGICKTIEEAFSGKEGDACWFPDKPLCASGLYCIVQSASSTGIDAKCGKSYASGAACQIAIPDACPTDEYCKVVPDTFSGTCTKRPGDGQPCAKLYDSDLCAAGTRCENGTCRSVQKQGGQCATDDVCYSETCAKGECVPAGGC